MTATAVSDANFESEVLESELPVLVDFWAPWCGPCKAMSPVVEAIADEYVGQVKVVKVDVDDAPLAAATHGVVSIPTFMVFQDGKPETQFTGARSKQVLVNAFKPYLN